MLRSILILSILILFPNYLIAADQYETEPNDTKGSADLIVETGIYYLYGHAWFDDMDWFAISITEPGVIIVSLNVPSAPEFNDDYYRYIYDPVGVQIGYMRDAGDQVIMLPKSGTYYLLLERSYYGTDAQYALQIDVTNFSNQCPE